MSHHLSGRLHRDTTCAAPPGWLLFLDRLPGDAPTMLTGFATDVPRDASHAEVVHLIGEMLYRETGHLPWRGRSPRSRTAPAMRLSLPTRGRRNATQAREAARESADETRTAGRPGQERSDCL
jgi:hypothetical protein